MQENIEETKESVMLGLYIEGLRVFYHAVNEYSITCGTPDLIGGFLDALSKFSDEIFGKELTEVTISDIKINLFKFKIGRLDAIIYSIGKLFEEDDKRDRITECFRKLAEFVEQTSEFLKTEGDNIFLKDMFIKTANEICCI